MPDKDVIAEARARLERIRKPTGTGGAWWSHDQIDRILTEAEARGRMLESKPMENDS